MLNPRRKELFDFFGASDSSVLREMRCEPGGRYRLREKFLASRRRSSRRKGVPGAANSANSLGMLLRGLIRVKLAQNSVQEALNEDNFALFDTRIRESGSAAAISVAPVDHRPTMDGYLAERLSIHLSRRAH